MINRANIGKAVETILKQNLEGYTIVRNEKRNEDPNAAAEGKGWIGIYRGKISYAKATTGPNPWRAIIEQVVEIQCASMTSGDDLEERIQAAEDEVLETLKQDHTIGGTVLSIREFEVTDELNEATEIYHQASIITIRAEART